IDATVARRLDAHVRTCHACQLRLQSFEQLRLVLRSQRLPNLQTRVWRDLQARIAHEGVRSSGSGGRRRGPVVGALAAAAAVLVVILLAAVLVSQRGGIGGSVETTPTAGRTPTSAPVAGWQPSSLTGASCFDTFIVVAPSDPQTLYACRVGQDHAIAVSVSHDAGTTWSAPVKSALEGQPPASLLTGSPTKAQDLILAWQINQGANVMYRSLDGGVHWRRLTDVGNLTFGHLGWAGSMAVISTQLTENPVTSATEVYISRDGAPFVRIDQGGKLGSFDTNGAYINLITGHDATIYIQSTQFGTIRSTDGGATWRQATFKDSTGQPLHLLTGSADGHTLVAVHDNAPNRIAISNNDGKTWRSVAALPAQ